MANLEAVGDLTHKMGALSIENGTSCPAVQQNESAPKAVDFEYLQSHHFVDETGKLPSDHKNCFNKKITLQGQERILQFLNEERQLGEKKVTLQELIFTHLAVAGSDPCLLGEELYKLIGEEQLVNGVADITKADASGLKPELKMRTTKSPDTLTVRIGLDEKMADETRHALALGYQQKLAAVFGPNAVSKCYPINDDAHFSTFSVTLLSKQGKLRLNVVFSTILKNKFVATGDGVQVVLPAKGGIPYLIDHDIGDQWVIDTVFKLLRIPHSGKQLSKILFRYLRDGYAVCGKELEIFKNEIMSTPSSYALLSFCGQLTQDPHCTPDQLLHTIFLAALVADRLGYGEIARDFVQDAIKSTQARFGQTMPKDGFVIESLDLVTKGTLSLKELASLMLFFGRLFGSHRAYRLEVTSDFCAAIATTVAKYDAVKSTGWLKHFMPSSSSNCLERSICRKTVQAIEDHGCTSCVGFLAHALLYRQTSRSSLRDLLITQFYPILRSETSQAQALLTGAMAEVLQPGIAMQAPKSEIDWIQSLLLAQSMELQRVGFDLLYKLAGHIECKKKWIAALIKEPSGQALRFIMQLQDSITTEEMSSWMKGFSQRSYLFYQLLTVNETKWLTECVKVDPREVFNYYKQIATRDKQKGQRVLAALATVGNAQLLPYSVVSAWAKELEEGFEKAPHARILECLRPHAPERDNWPEDVARCFKVSAPMVSDAERNLMLATIFPLLMHPQAIQQASAFVARSVRYLLDNDVPLSSTQKTHLRFMCPSLVRSTIDQKQLLNALRIIDMHQKYAGEMKDEETRKLILTTFEHATTLAKAHGEWYLSNRALFPAKLLPANQLRILLRLCEMAPTLIESTLAGFVQQLHGRLQHAQDFTQLCDEVEAARAKAVGHIGCFDELFLPFLPKKKPEPVVAKSVPVKKPPSNHVDLKKLLREGKLQELIIKLLPCDANDEEAKKLVKPLVEALIKKSPSDPEKNIFTLFEHFQITDFELWRLLIMTLSQQLEFASITVGIGVFSRMRSDPLPVEHKALWYAIMTNPLWLCHTSLYSLLQEITFFRGVLQAVRPETWNMEWQNLSYRFVQTLMNEYQNSPERSQVLPIMHLWFNELVGEDAKFEIGCDLLSNGNPFGSFDDFQRDSKLLQTLAPLASHHVLPAEHAILARELAKQKKVRAALQETAKSFERFLVPMAGFLRSARIRLDDVRAVHEIRSVVVALGKAETTSIDTLLIMELEQYPQEVQDALAGPLARMAATYMRNPKPSADDKKFADKLLAFVDRMLNFGSVRALCDLYSKFFYTELSAPSECTVGTLVTQAAKKNEIDYQLMGPFQRTLYELFSRGYPRFLEGCLKHEDPLCARVALNVDISLTVQASNQLAELTRRQVPKYNQLFLELFVRHIEGFGWNEQTVKFIAHIIYLQIHPVHLSSDFNPDNIDLTKLKEESCEVIYTLINHERFYFAAHQRLNPPQTPSEKQEIIGYSRPLILKQFPTFLPSEKKFFEFSCRLLNIALARIKQTPPGAMARARLFDFLTSSLRVLLELYPQASLASYLAKFFNACDKQDPLFEAHKKIAFGILRLAVYKKVITPETNELVQWLSTCGKTVNDLTSASDAPLLAIDAKLNAMRENASNFSAPELVACQNQVLSWLDTHFVENFEGLARTMKSIFATWYEHPEVIRMSSVLHSMDSLVVPNSVFLGMDRGLNGKKFAFELATLYLDTLYAIYTRSMEVPQNTLLVSVLNGLFVPLVLSDVLGCKNAMQALNYTLKRCQRFGVFEGRYDDYAAQIKRLIQILTNNQKLAPSDLEEYVVQFVHTCTLRCADPNTLGLRITLVNDWVKALLGNMDKLGGDTVKRAMVQLICSKIIMEVPCEHADTLIQWLAFIDAYPEKEKRQLQPELLEQLSAVKSRFIDPQERKKFIKKLPKFLQIETS